MKKIKHLKYTTNGNCTTITYSFNGVISYSFPFMGKIKSDEQAISVIEKFRKSRKLM